jgi:hypothetical protein
VPDVPPAVVTETVPAPAVALGEIVTVVVISVGVITRAPAVTPALLKVRVAPETKLAPVIATAN